jgi:hypothetical protein
MKNKIVIVNDKMQKNYKYERGICRVKEMIKFVLKYTVYEKRFFTCIFCKNK